MEMVSKTNGKIKRLLKNSAKTFHKPGEYDRIAAKICDTLESKNRFSQNLVELRKKRGCTQEQLADELKVTKARIGSYEENRCSPPLEMLLKMADFFGITIDQLVR